MDDRAGMPSNEVESVQGFETPLLGEDQRLEVNILSSLSRISPIIFSALPASFSCLLLMTAPCLRQSFFMHSASQNIHFMHPEPTQRGSSNRSIATTVRNFRPSSSTPEEGFARLTNPGHRRAFTVTGGGRALSLCWCVIRDA